MLFNLENWENIINFGNLFASIGKKTYFLALGTIPETGVGFLARKITDKDGPIQDSERKKNWPRSEKSRGVEDYPATPH